MTKLLWDQVGERMFETGVDRGVLYLPNGTAVPWNGITSIAEDYGDPADPLYFDGIKYYDMPTVDDYSATLNVFTYPDEFLQFDGVMSLGKGLFVQDQGTQVFDLSYRTLIGNDVLGTDFGYKIHILYNLTATPDAKAYESLSGDPSLMDLSYKISGTPELVPPGYRPTSHVIVDTTQMNQYMVRDLEDILYGTATTPASLPSLLSLVSMVSNWNLITIIDNGDGTWTASGPPELITMTNPTTFQISGVSGTYLDANTYTVTTTPA